MAQEYGAAQPIADWVKTYVANPVVKTMEAIDKLPPTSSTKTDTSWHEGMVRKANESFAKDQQKRGTTMKGTATSSGTRKSTQKRKRTGKTDQGK